MTVTRTESTDPVLLLPDESFAESAAPKVLALMSDAAHEALHRSVEPPYVTKVSVDGQAVALDLSAVPINPPFTIRAALSAMVPPLLFAYSQST